jgi:hypothetical protein
MSGRRFLYLVCTLVETRGVIAGDWIDPDTPTEYLSTPSLVDGSTKDLVFSDEFNVVSDDRAVNTQSPGLIVVIN